MTKEDDVNSTPTVEARRAFEQILQSEQSLQEGRTTRDQAIIALREQGMSLRAIAAALRQEAERAGLTEEQIAALGISFSAINMVLRSWESIKKDRAARGDVE